MHRPSSTALSARARTLLEHMHRREHWVYALPTEARAMVLSPTTALVVTRRDDLEVTLVEARGESAALELAELLAAQGFFAQSALLESAHDVATDDARKALSTLAHMAVGWDAAWAELFELHLRDEAGATRGNASDALLVAARASGAYAEVRATLEAARARERDLAVTRAIDAALTALLVDAGAARAP